MDAPSALAMRVSELALHPVVRCPESCTIADAARRMSEAKTDTLVALDREGRPTGILTDLDLRERVVAAGADPGAPLETVLSAPVVVIRGDAVGYQAVEAMLGRGIHHLVVVDPQGRATAVLADRDLLVHGSAAPILLVRRIEHATSVDELAAARRAYPTTLLYLLESGAGARAALAILAEANDRVQRCLIELAQGELGRAPLPFAWLVMGSEGRRTQTLRTDQDNGIVWTGVDERAAEYFAGLGRWMVDALERTGLPRCAGDVMATNPLWRGPVEAWRERFELWLREPEPEALLRSLIAFDLRAAAGDEGIGEGLRAWLMERTPQARLLLIHCAREALRRAPPLGPLGRLRLDRSGAFDAKLDAIGIIVDCARLFALERGVLATNTLDRLSAAAAAGVLPTEDAQAAAAAYDALQVMRLRRQTAQAASGIAPTNQLVPRELGRADRVALREHLVSIRRLQDGIADRYGAAVLRA